MGSLARLLGDGWTLVYSDSTQRGSEVAAGTFIQWAKDNGNRHEDFLGNLASVADGELKGLALAIQLAPIDSKVYILLNSITAIHAALQLSGGSPLRSGIVVELLNTLTSRK